MCKHIYLPIQLRARQDLTEKIQFYYSAPAITLLLTQTIRSRNNARNANAYTGKTGWHGRQFVRLAMYGRTSRQGSCHLVCNRRHSSAGKLTALMICRILQQFSPASFSLSGIFLPQGYFFPLLLFFMHVIADTRWRIFPKELQML